MDLNCNHLVPESVEDNARSVHADYTMIINNGSCTNEVSTKNVSANGSLPDDNHEKDVGSAEQVNTDLVKAKSPGGPSPSTTKGYGLKKWRRIKREGLVKDGAINVDSSKVLKRGLVGPVNPPSKPVNFSSVEAKQSSEGSVGSVNMANYPGAANEFSPDLDSRFVIGLSFPAGVESENSEDPNSKSSKASARNTLCIKTLGGKIILGSSSRGVQQGKSRIDTIKKARGERVKTEDSPCSSLDSDLGSANFVVSNGAFSVVDNGKQRERLMNPDGEYRKEGREGERPFNEEVQNGHGRENREEEEEEEAQDGTQNRHPGAEKDPLVDSVCSLAAVQEALEKEVQSLREIRRDFIPLHHNADEPSPSVQLGNESSKEKSPTSVESQELILKQNVKHLESKIEEAKAMLEAKEAKIWELENLKIEFELERLFQRKIEAEIEHLMIAMSLRTSGVLEERNKTQLPGKAETKTEDSKRSLGDISGKACKFSLCFLMQLILLVFVLRLFIFQLFPDSQAVIPT